MKRKLGLIASLFLVCALAFAQTGQNPALVTYAQTNPSTTSCKAGYMWWNTTTNHLWICEAYGVTQTWVDVLAAVPSSGFPITATSGPTTVSLTGLPSAQTGSYTITNATEGAGWNAALGGTLGASMFAFSPTVSITTNLDVAAKTYTSSVVEGSVSATRVQGVAGGSATAVETLDDSGGTSHVSTLSANGFTQVIAHAFGGAYARTIAVVGAAIDTIGVTGASGSAATWSAVANDQLSPTQAASLTLIKNSVGIPSVSLNINDAAGKSGSFGGSTVGGVTILSATATDSAQSGQSQWSGSGVRITTTGTKPTCDATTRRNSWFVDGGVGVTDTYEVCMKSAANTYAWVVVATNP